MLSTHHLIFPSKCSFSTLEIFSSIASKIFLLCLLLSTSFLLQNIHSVPYRLHQVLPPKFSFLCNINSLLPQKCAFSALNITSAFPSKMLPRSPWHPLPFSYTNNSCVRFSAKNVSSVPSKLSQVFLVRSCKEFRQGQWHQGTAGNSEAEREDLPGKRKGHENISAIN